MSLLIPPECTAGPPVPLARCIYAMYIRRMTKEYRARVFKSGNSFALRLPRELGLGEGEELVVVPHDGGRFTLWKHGESLAVLMSLYGTMSPNFMKDGRGDIEQEERDWQRSAAKSVA